MQRLLSLLSIFVASQAFAVGDAPLPDFLQTEDDTREVVALSYQELQTVLTGDLQHDLAIQLGLLHTGTPYDWGGDSWDSGVDCSHFTRKVFATAATGYQDYMQTKQLRDLRDANGMVAVPFSDMRPGDLLVYGYYDDEDLWQGHVVILIDADYTAGDFQGLVLGSHGDVGVQFLTVAGFPSYFRKPHITLRNVLRVTTSPR